MVEFKRFGDPARFAVEVRWADDSEPRSRRPSAHGWSMGDLCLTVGGVLLTRSAWGGRSQRHVGWYLSPIVDWIATNWRELFHEEDFGWREPTGLPAAVACRRALHKWIDAEDDDARKQYASIQRWYVRHGLRSGAEGGLLPDLFIRRLMDDVEISWNATAPVHAPREFAFVFEPAHACLPVADVAEPLWSLLRWFCDTPPQGLDEADKLRWEAIVRKIEGLEHLSAESLERTYLPDPLADFLFGNGAERAPDAVRRQDFPVVEHLTQEVAMFGGLSPNLSTQDATELLAILGAAEGKQSARLEELVVERGYSPLTVPHRDAEDFARDLLDDLLLPGEGSWIDVRGIVKALGICVQDRNFDSREIRGVALAGDGFAPIIVVNRSSVYNGNEEGRRYTIAHELCHILHDRSRARRISHVSGPWVAQGFERRANAFAAYFLMPRALVLRSLGNGRPNDKEAIRRAAGLLVVNESALLEHLYNLEMIDDLDRMELRPVFRRAIGRERANPE